MWSWRASNVCTVLQSHLAVRLNEALNVVGVIIRCSVLHHGPFHALSAQFTVSSSTVWSIYRVLPPHAHTAVGNCVAGGEIKGPQNRNL